MFLKLMIAGQVSSRRANMHQLFLDDMWMFASAALHWTKITFIFRPVTKSLPQFHSSHGYCEGVCLKLSRALTKT